MITSTTISKIASALVQAQGEMSNAVKDASNPYYKSKYADLNSIREAVLPSLNKHKIAALQPTVVIDGKKYVETTLLHESGEFIACITEILAAKDNDAQQQGSGISYARRYGLQSLLNIGAEDDDGNAASGKQVSTIEPMKKPTLTKPVPLNTERAKNLDWIKKELTKQPKWKTDWKGTMKMITGVATVKELEELPDQSLLEISKLLLTTFKIGE